MTERSNTSFIRPFNNIEKLEKEAEKKLKQALTVTIVGYGEKRDSRIIASIENETKRRALKKCEDLGCSLSEAVNQLLFIWSKDKDLPILRKLDISKVDKRTNITIEKTTKAKADKKCNLLDCTLSEAVNCLLHIWTQDVDLSDESERHSEILDKKTEQPEECYIQQSLLELLNGDYK